MTASGMAAAMIASTTHSSAVGGPSIRTSRLPVSRTIGIPQLCTVA